MGTLGPKVSRRFVTTLQIAKAQSSKKSPRTMPRSSVHLAFPLGLGSTRTTSLYTRLTCKLYIYICQSLAMLTFTCVSTYNSIIQQYYYSWKLFHENKFRHTTGFIIIYSNIQLSGAKNKKKFKFSYISIQKLQFNKITFAISLM